MKATFDLQTWLSDNREVVISKYNELTTEQFFNNITLKEFMLEVINAMVRNNIKSEKRAENMLPFYLGDIYCNNSKIVGEDKKTNELTKKYAGTAFMALV